MNYISSVSNNNKSKISKKVYNKLNTFGFSNVLSCDQRGKSQPVLSKEVQNFTIKSLPHKTAIFVLIYASPPRRYLSDDPLTRIAFSQVIDCKQKMS